MNVRGPAQFRVARQLPVSVVNDYLVVAQQFVAH